MTIRSVGYEGSVGELEWSAYLANNVGRPQSVAGPGDFEVTATSGMQVRVAAGGASGHGIADVSDAAESITIESVASGTRFDAVVLRRDWSGTSTTPTGGATQGRTFVAVVKGGSAQMIPALQSIPGQLADQPLALVRVTAGQSTVTVTDDLRATYSSTAVVRSLLAMNGPLGTQYALAPTGKRYYMAQSAAGTVTVAEEWEPPAQVLPAIPRLRTGVILNTQFNSTGTASVVHGLGYVPAYFHASYRNTAASNLVTLNLAYQTGSVSTNNALLVAKRTDKLAQDSWLPYTGMLSHIDWIAVG